MAASSDHTVQMRNKVLVLAVSYCVTNAHLKVSVLLIACTAMLLCPS
jgi:hypothetical protein